MTDARRGGATPFRVPLFLAEVALICAALSLLNIRYGLFPRTGPVGILFVGYMMLLGGRITGGLGTVLQNHPRLHPLPAYLLRMVCWWLGTGVGYTAAVLLAKKFGLLGVYDTPVRDIFDFGARAGCCMLTAADLLHHFFRRNPGTHGTHGTIDRKKHDNDRTA